MNNLQSVVVLLQLVLSLLSNPSTAHSPQAALLASQAITFATQALQVQQAALVAPSPTPGTGIGAPDLGSINPAPVSPVVAPAQPAPVVVVASTTPPIEAPVAISPQCSLQGTRIVATDTQMNDTVDLLWTSQGIATGTNLYIMSARPDGTWGDEIKVTTTLNGEYLSKSWNHAWRMNTESGVYCFATIQ